MKAQQKTLKKQKEELQGEGTRNEHNTTNVLKDELKKKDPERVINALKVFEKLDPVEFEFALLDQLNSKYANVRTLAYKKLDDFLCYGALGIIVSESKTEGDEAAELAAQETF